MTQEEKDLILKDLCARLPHGVICKTSKGNGHLCSINQTIFGIEYGINIKATERDYFNNEEEIKPYLRPLSSMTEEEARDIAILHGYNPVEILSTKVTDEYIDIILNDGVCYTIISTILYDEIISSLECFDYLNKKMFDYRGLIPKSLALSIEVFNPY